MRAGITIGPRSRFIPANPSVAWTVRRRSQHPKDRLQFFFSFELSYLRVPTKPRLGGLPKISDRLSQKPLATRTFIVQNNRVWSLVTRRATALNRADFGRLSRVGGNGLRIANSSRGTRPGKTTSASRVHATSFLAAKFEIGNDKSACSRYSGIWRCNVLPGSKILAKRPGRVRARTELLRGSMR
jgi:hypothetical protein